MTWRLESINSHRPLSQGGLCSHRFHLLPSIHSSYSSFPQAKPCPLCSVADTQQQHLWPVTLFKFVILTTQGNRMEPRLPEINVTASRFPYKNLCLFKLVRVQHLDSDTGLSIFFFSRPNNKGGKDEHGIANEKLEG